MRKSIKTLKEIEKESKIYFGELLLNGLQNQAEQLMQKVNLFQ